MLTSWPPTSPPVTSAVDRPRRALVSAALRPARPPPITTMSTSRLIVLRSSSDRARDRDTGSTGFRSADDARAPITRFADRLEHGVSAARHHGHEQAAGRLRIGEQMPLPLGDPDGQLDLRSVARPVA